MNKEYIINLLAKGFSSTKKYTADDFCRKLYILRYIIEDGEIGVGLKDNDFWSADNNKNRTELINDIYRINRFKMSDTSYFHIISRFENGDGYGIMKMQKYVDIFNARLSYYGTKNDMIKDTKDYVGLYNYISNEDFELYQGEVKELLDMFYILEDKTDYENKDISKIIDYLQEK